MRNKRIIIDANIMIRGIFGKKVFLLMRDYPEIDLFAPDVCFADANKYAVALADKRNWPQDEVKKALELIANIVINIPNSLYQYYKTEAVERIGNRDIDDEREVKK